MYKSIGYPPERGAAKTILVTGVASFLGKQGMGISCFVLFLMVVVTRYMTQVLTDFPWEKIFEQIGQDLSRSLYNYIYISYTVPESPFIFLSFVLWWVLAREYYLEPVFFIISLVLHKYCLSSHFCTY